MERVSLVFEEAEWRGPETLRYADISGEANEGECAEGVGVEGGGVDDSVRPLARLPSAARVRVVEVDAEVDGRPLFLRVGCCN